jgi:methylmalonyl-CoA/ethylmalonyl-CoA epimerase
MTISNSTLFKINKVHQTAYVVQDVDKSMERMWTLFGIGPWGVHIRDANSTEDHSIISDQVFMGKPAHYGYKLASAVLEGGLSIELIQPTYGDSTFSDFLKKRGEGMHHIGWHILPSYDEFLKTAKMLEENGFPCLQSARVLASRMAYFDTTKVLNTIFEIVYHDPERKRPDPLYIYPTPT